MNAHVAHGRGEFLVEATHDSLTGIPKRSQTYSSRTNNADSCDVTVLARVTLVFSEGVCVSEALGLRQSLPDSMAHKIANNGG